MAEGLSERERRVCALVRGRERALVEDLRRHVGIATGGRNVAGLEETTKLLTARATALGATVEVVPGGRRPEWLYGEAAGVEPVPTVMLRRESARGASGKPILIAGHMDTVHDPRGAFRELTVSGDGTRGTGPGCVDMKGGLVIAMAALEALEEAGERVEWTLLLNSDEETGSFHSAKAIMDEAGRVAEAGGVGICVEPATPDGGLVIERAGSAQFVIEAQGKSAHVGRDFASGVSAVQGLAEVLVRAGDVGRGLEGVIVNVGPLEGGRATNIVPERARGWGNVRFGTEALGEEVVRRLGALGGRASNGARIEVRSHIARPAKPATAEVMRFAEMVRRCSEGLGQRLPFSKTSGACDGNLMQGAGLITLDTLGVRGGGLHTSEEWIEMASLVERCELLAVVMMRAGSGD